VAPPGFLADDSLVVGTVGRLAEVKNQASLLRAVHQVLQQHPELDARLRVIIVGDGPMAASIRQAVIDLGLEPHVWLAGDRHDIPELLQSMDVFALPSLGEGISNTVLEATASGLPVIATDVGGNPELVQDGFNGLLVPVGDDAALADAITDLVIDADRRETMGANAAGKVRAAFDWRRTVAEYLSVYDELIGGVAPQTDREDIPHA
jgi:glycosyltransferase involved in cell wall biosynthesis